MVTRLQRDVRGVVDRSHPRGEVELVDNNALDFGSAAADELASRATEIELETLSHGMTRNTLALGLAALLGVLTLTTLVAAIAGVELSKLMQIGQLTITPVVALCGIAFGFYFAQQAADGR